MCFRPPSVGKPQKCPECGALNPGAAKTCVKCKAALPEVKPEPIVCPKCGTENEAGAMVCKECGITAAQLAALSKRTKKCPVCRAANPGLSKTCSKCGSELLWQ